MVKIDGVEFVTFDELQIALKEADAQPMIMSDELIADLGMVESFGAMFNKEKWIKMFRNELSEPLIPMDYTDIAERIKYWNEKNEEFSKEFLEKYKETEFQLWGGLTYTKPSLEQMFEDLFYNPCNSLQEEKEKRDCDQRVAKHVMISLKKGEVDKDKELGERYLIWRDKIKAREINIYEGCEL